MREPLPVEFETALQLSAARRGSFGTPAYFFSEIGSTNDFAMQLAESGATEGTTVVASAQTSGRGRFGRTWFSPPGAGLYTSVIIRESRRAALLTLAGGVAIAIGIRSATGLHVEIKWPNDIVVDVGRGRRRKLAGLLAEASATTDGVQHVVLGFGINLRPAAYPPEIQDRATSLETELGRRVDAGVVLAECLVGLSQQIDDLRVKPPGHVLSRWSDLAPSSRGTTVEWDTPEGTRRGSTEGIDEEGALLVRSRLTTERIIAGTVRWLE